MDGPGDSRNLRDLIQTAQRIQSEVARVKDELSAKTVEGESGGGMVRCVVSGTGELLELTIEPALATLPAPDGLDGAGSKKMLEDLVVGAVNVALERARELARQEMARVTGGFPCRPECSGPDRLAYAGPIARLVQQLGKLPGIGEKTAARLAFHILRASSEDAAALAAAITEVKQKIRFCGVCCDLTDRDPCAICSDARRETGVVCVVAQPQDVVAVERAAGFRGRYHVLHGVLSPLDGIGPDDLRIAELIRRCCAAGVEEVILATSPSVEGRPPRSTSPSWSDRWASGPPESPPACRSGASWSTPTR